ncbi:DUF6390 family protein [Rhodococcus sp. G-MC3]|uniref:DUF6390 family protein n=1 Tax=Rhodococcus sp. G-MC3 TaxID=3046209 RepID=UPI0024B97005|nr:DUF6390 family protein [Rhodococcus sp. G-MC3]MDJ0394690.1 DUF6390 family protein [Rhodococcus sp. G-MC3]
MTNDIDAGQRGPVLFNRYAYPPNELGYCGPDGSADLLARLSSGVGDMDLRARARGFDGAWPYLETLATTLSAADSLPIDPLDAEVVHAYWVGSDLTSSVDPKTLIDRLRVDFAGQSGGVVHDIDFDTDCMAHHSFHVFAVYPWLRLLPRGADVPLAVLQQCRVRWGTVVSVSDEYVDLLSEPLQFLGGTLSLGAPVAETARWSSAGRSLLARPNVGDLVSLHWDWVCDRIDAMDVHHLQRCTDASISVANRALQSM